MQSKFLKKALSFTLSIALLSVSLFTGVSVLAEEGTYTANRLSIHPGIDDTVLNFTWQSTEQAETAAVRIKAEGAVEWTVFTGESKAFVISEDGYEEGYHDTFVKNCGHTCSDICGHEACTASQCYHGTYTDPYYNRVTVSGLEYGVSYTYQLGDGTNWTADYTTQIADSDPDEGFSYLVFGDSQTADQYYGDYMKKALELSVDKFDDIDFLMNLGDNVHENNDRNYNAYYTAQDILAQYPIAVVLGNHELNLCTNGDRINFSDHPTLALQNPPAADERQDYWFRYGDVLFITFNSGPQQTSMMADLEQLIIDAKAAHPDTRWTILQTHQGFYANNGGGKVWRKDFTSIISKYDIDLVFNGHHHQYTRTESLVFDSSLTCSHSKNSPDFSCAACSGSVESLGENDVTVAETFVGAVKTTEPYYEELEGVSYNKTVERYDPEGVTFIHLDSLTAEGHDQYATIAGSTLAPTSAFSINTIEGQGAITKVTVGKDAEGNDELNVETYWINNNGTPRVSDNASLTLLDDDYIEDTPYDTYTIHKTTAVKDVEVTFDGGTDRGIFTRKINSGEAVAEPANPIMTGKSFKYWTLDGETEYDFATTLTADTTLTAVYEDIPPTATANLFIEAVNRGDSEIILAGDITLTDVVTLNSNTTIKSADGQKYTITLDGAARLVIAKGKKVTFDGIGITIASTANTIADAYNNGTYITVGSGGNRADLYVYNCTINNLLTDMGSSGTGVIASSKNASSAVRFKNSVITSGVTNTSTGGSILGQYITVYAIDTSMTNAKSGAWFCTSSTKIIMYGSSSYVGWKHSSAKLYDFRNVTVKITRNKDNLIELTKIGTGTAATSDSYVVYYAFEDTAFSAGTAIEYTEPIAGVDYETPIYATVRYTGTSYHGDVTYKTCGEYIDGVLVDTAEAFITAITNGDTPINLTSNITLTDLGEVKFGANTVVQSKSDGQYSVTLEGTSRLTITAGKTVTFKNIDIIVPENSAVVSDPWTNGDKITVGSDNSKATLYIENCTIDCQSTDIGGTTNAVIISNMNASSNIHIINSTIKAAIASNQGSLLGGSNPKYFISDSTLSCATGEAWVCTSGATMILKGTSTYYGWPHSSAKIYNLTNASVKAARNKDNLIELSKVGTGTAASDETYKIYYSIGDDVSGTTNEYTEPIADVDYETPIYVTIRYPETSYYTDAEAKVCGEYIEGVAVGNAESFKEAIANGESLLTLTSDITLTDLGILTISTNTVIQSKDDQKYSIYLDGNTRLTVAANKTVTLDSLKVYLAETATPITDSSNDAYYNGFITVKTGAKLYINNSHVESLLTNMGCSTASIIKIYRYDGSTGYVEINNSSVVSPSGQDKGIALSAIVFGTNTKPTFRVVDSSIKGHWIFYQGFYILEGSTQLLGNAYRYNAQIMDYRSADITAKREDGNVVLSVDGDVKYKAKNSDTVSTVTDYKLYYSVGDDKSGTTTEYTGAIEGVNADTPIYVTIQMTKTYDFYSTPQEITVPEIILGDNDGDGVVEAEDLTDIRKSVLSGMTDPSIADLSGDGIVDILDLVLINALIPA